MFYTATEETYHDGQIIIKEGASGDWVYVILSGKVEISRTIGEKRFVIEVLQPGEVFGELGFFAGIPRTATARALGNTTVGVIDREFLDREFNKLSSDFRTILGAVVERFSKMLDRTCDFTSREQIRIIESWSVKYRDGASFLEAFTGNVSSGGLFIETDHPLEQGEQFSLELGLPDVPESLKIKCEVVWAASKAEKLDRQASRGMGVRFLEMTKKDHQILKGRIEEIQRKKERDSRRKGLMDS
jgi:uncharacterized protein (TIGR02266 family)